MKNSFSLRNLNKRKFWVITAFIILVLAGASFVLKFFILNADTPPRATIDNFATVTYKDASGDTHKEQSDTVQVAKEETAPSPESDTKSDATQPKVKISLTKLHPNAGGYSPENLNLNDEYIVIKNLGETVDTSYWKVKNSKNEIITLPTYKFSKNSTITIYSGSKPKCYAPKALHICKSIPANYFFLGRKTEMWNNQHDTITLYQGSRVLLSQSY